MPISSIRPSPENDKLYRPVDPDEREFVALVESVREHGILDPLVVTDDGYILSGHRRTAAAKVAGLTHIPCRVLPIRRHEDIDKFIVLLREHNRSREKTNSEKLHEELVSMAPDEAYQSLIQHRRERARVKPIALEIVGSKRRKQISGAKRHLVEAILAILERLRDFWPLSDRQIHYQLLNDPPLRHASKPNSHYRNHEHSYGDLTDLLTRLRIVGTVPMHAIADATRPIITWNVHQSARSFLRKELDEFLNGYWRNLQQGQPNHIEIIGEKNTLKSILQPVAAKFCIPMTIGRGYCSLPPRAKMAERYHLSGRDKLILLILSDLDPDGMEICQSFARSMRDDFSIANIHPIKVALTPEQVIQYGLPRGEKATSKKSAQRKKFVAAHGEYVYELEALQPSDLQKILTQAIDSVIDIAAFNHELDRERDDAAFLRAARQRAAAALKGVADEKEDDE